MKVNGTHTRTIWLEADGWSVGIIDQTMLPHRYTTLRLTTLAEAAHVLERLGFRRELEAVADPTERAELEAQLLAQMYERGRAVNAAAVVELDDVIDPVDTRQWITTALGEVDHTDVPRGYVDTW